MAMPLVIFGTLAILLMTLLIRQLAGSQVEQAALFAREDTVLAGTEAMLERYAAKMTIDPLYYQRYVDEAEAPRQCTDSSSTGFGVVVSPGTAWIEDCQTWDYAQTTTFYTHPLLVSDDDIEVLVHVTPPTAGVNVQIEVVGRQNGKVNPRVVTAEVSAVAISEFVRMVETDLRYGAGAKTYGKVYVGNNIGYLSGGEAYADVYAENAIGFTYFGQWYGPPTWMNDAEGFDSSGNHNAAGATIDQVYPDPIDFDRFWDDLDLIQSAACEGGGICLDPAVDTRIPSGVKAYLIESQASAGGTLLKVSYATAVPSSPSNASCLTSEERWWVNSAGAFWTLLDTFEIPDNGALWANEHVVVARNVNTPFVLDGALTIYAGNSSARRNIVIGADVLYDDPTGSGDVLGLIASDEVWVNPYAVGTDRDLEIRAAILNQNGNMRVALTCGSSGSSLTPSSSVLNMWGSNASIGTGNFSCCFTVRNYNFDERLARLRPPLFPLLSGDWSYSQWRETPTPCWGKPAGC